MKGPRIIALGWPGFRVPQVVKGPSGFDLRKA